MPTENLKTPKAVAVFGPENAAGEAIFYRVGVAAVSRYKGAPVVSDITVTRDLPGPHCMIDEVRVYGDGILMFRAPFYMMEGVTFEGETDAA